jgi:hypothetical protein
MSENALGYGQACLALLGFGRMVTFSLPTATVIHKPTLFIVGAGGSCPYGFPTGGQLKERICREVQTNGEVGRLLADAGHSAEARAEFSMQFEASHLASIDSFIARRPEYREIAEHAIAAVLLPLEYNIPKWGVKGDWYGYVWNLLVADAQKPGDIRKNDLRVITFNYDRSLEMFLWEAVKSSFGVSADEAFQLVGNLDIHHMYGTLGDYQGDRFLYPRLDADAVRGAGRSIKTVPLLRGELDEKARAIVHERRNSFFLGFGFDPMNCHRLGFPLKVGSQSFSAHATAIDVTPGEIGLYSNRIMFTEHLPLRPELSYVQGDCLALLRSRAGDFS